MCVLYGAQPPLLCAEGSMGLTFRCSKSAKWTREAICRPSQSWINIVQYFRGFNSLLLGWWESILVEMLFFQSHDWPQNPALLISTFSTLDVIAPLLYRAQGHVMCHSTMVKYRWRDSLFNIQELISQWLAGHSMMTAKQASLQYGT